MTTPPAAGQPGHPNRDPGDIGQPGAPPSPSGRIANACSGPEFRLRVLSALVMVPIALGALWLGGLAFAALVAIGGALMLAEWRGIIAATARPVVVFALAFAVGVAILIAEIWRLEAGFALIAALAIVAAVEPATAGGRPHRGLLFAGVLYSGLPWLAAVSIRAGADGMLAMAFVFTVVWATDIGAYFAGRTLGGPKLMPRVSPKKTWSGALGGLAAAVLLGTALIAVAGDARLLPAAIAAALMSVAAQAGDLFESSLKRRFGVKDSGTIIPGHGGVLDRVDGLVAALIVAWLIGIGPGPIAAAFLAH